MRFFLIIFLTLLFNTIVFAQEYVSPSLITTLSSDVNEASGLLNLDGDLWTHNDHNGTPTLFQIDETDGSILQNIIIQNATNEDWEDITSDDDYLYIGDFGNNWGNRTDLKIYKVSLEEIDTSNIVNAEIINFYYDDQTSWEENHNNHDFDCEAIISLGDKLYLFSKNWVDGKTRVYELSKQSGFQTATYLDTYDVDGLITGAEILPNNILTLIGYKSNGISFTWIFNDFEGFDFFGGNQIKLNWTQIAQIEGVCYSDVNEIYVVSEEYEFLSPTLFKLDFSEYTTSISTRYLKGINIYSSGKNLIINSMLPRFSNGNIRITNLNGKTLKIFENIDLNVKLTPELNTGIYIITLESGKRMTAKKLFIN